MKKTVTVTTEEENEVPKTIGTDTTSTSSSQTAVDNPINIATLKALENLFFSGQKLPGAGGGVKMTGEDHIVAILYDTLIDGKKGSDCAIIIKPPTRELLPENFNAESMPRYLIVPMSVNNNMHNTVLIIDHTKKEYAYFDSLGGSIPKGDLDELKSKKAIKPDYTNVDTSSRQTMQTDGWSCGFHAVENAIAYVTGTEPKNKEPLGDSLRNKYAPSFERFVQNHAKSEYVFNDKRVSRRQKMRVRDALENVIKISESNQEKHHF